VNLGGQHLIFPIVSESGGKNKRKIKEKTGIFTQNRFSEK